MHDVRLSRCVDELLAGPQPEGEQGRASLAEDERNKLHVKRFCKECARVRPDRFPEAVVKEAFKAS